MTKNSKTGERVWKKGKHNKHLLLITKYQMGIVEMLAGITNTMRTGINMVEKRTLVTVLMWISAIFAFLGMFGGVFGRPYDPASALLTSNCL
jgi:hypothetical protein